MTPEMTSRWGAQATLPNLPGCEDFVPLKLVRRNEIEMLGFKLLYASLCL